MKKPTVRIRVNSNGVQVWNAGKWISADEQVFMNVFSMLSEMFPEVR